MDRNRGIVLFTNVELTEVVLKDVKRQKRQKWERKKLQLSQDFTVAVKARGDISVEPVKGQKIEERVFTDLDVRNDDNRPSLSSNAAAEEHQDVSSKNTIDKLFDAITGGKDIGLWSSNIPEKMREY